ncbi:RHS repeat-associated protein [Actinoplanes octamycinicus]|uniref:RHS repeat-associated protein n=1 Tax=Actinoplanes octamycinicus TaxID=135948 RepID=A0A7W7GYX1_9ACTN|nr:DUF6531 domain-containing protein [Actinoplanes octamycinicus]MBB4740889.1 RHS repeat-associated protein [Actinoplanes octamycinicus]GIE55796.1 hypothetical protein Aoc01nite_11980 [Actinoplanes octamycinicus]
MGTSSARPDDLDDFVRGSRAADDELRTHDTRVRSAYGEFSDGNKWGHFDASSLITAFGNYIVLNGIDADWVAAIAKAFRAAGGDGDISRLPDAAIAASLKAAGLTEGRTSLTFDAPVAYGFPPTSGFADDPVNTASGNFVHKVSDLPGFSRVYNSRSTVVGAFGPGWSSWADVRLRASSDGVAYTGPDGQAAFFGRQGAGYGRVVGINATVEPVDDGLELRWFDGRVWRFDATGRIRSADRLTFGYTDGRLTSVDDVPISWTGDRITAVGLVPFVYDGFLTDDGTYTYTVEDGRITAVTDADGVVHVRNTYDADGRVLTQVSRFGRESRYVYLPGHVTVVGETDVYVHDDRGRLLSVTDAHGHTLSRTYDEWGNPVTVTDRDGSVVTMRWDDRGRLLRRGAFDYTYDELGRLVAVTAGTGASFRYRYAGADRIPAEVVDGEGGVTRLDVRDGLVHRVTDPDGVTLDFGFDDSRRLLSATDALGHVARLERDDRGRVTAAISPLGRRTVYRYDDRGRLAERVGPGGATWRYEYSPGGRLLAVTDPGGARRTTEFGPHGETSAVIDVFGERTTMDYDDNGNLARVVLPGGAKWDFSHDALSRLTAATDPAGATWLREYDATGTLTATVDPAGVRRSAVLDRDGRIAAVNDGLTGSAFEYDALGRATAHLRPDGTGAHAEYDRCGRRTTVIGPDGGRSRIEYTPAGRVARTVSPAGRVTVFEYDAAGRPSSRTDGAGRRVDFRYDADGMLVAVVRGELQESYEYGPDGHLVAQTTADGSRFVLAHDAAGRITAVTDPTGGTRRFEFDAAGRMTAAIDPLGGRTTYQHHPRGWVTTVTDPLGAVTTFGYDEVGRLTERIDPLGRRTTTEYDPAGRMLARTDGSGRTLRWSYDPSGRIVTITAGDGATLTFRRDRLGRPVSAEEGGRRVDLGWDPAGRLISRSRGGLTVRHGYDRDGLPITLTRPDGSVVTYRYDEGGALAAAGEITLRRDALGRLIRADGGDTTMTWEYAGGLPASYVCEGPSGRRTAHLSHDAAGRVVDDGTRTYRYDAAGQLITAGDTEFRYDRAGRLVHDGASVYAYDTAGQLISRGGTVFEYDGAGRRTREGDRRYVWDGLGRLSAVDDLTLRHDPFGELAEVAGQAVFWEPGAAGMPCWLGDRPVTGPGTPWTVGATPLTPDWQGTPGDRDAWGAPAGTEPGIGYRGELEFAGLVWLRHRVYDPSARAFLSTDPLPPSAGTAVAGNPYHYAGNDPVGHADPLGLRPVSDADLRAYRDEMSSGFFEDAGEWVGENWEYIAAGAMVVGGIAVMATGVGGPIGAAMIGGALLSMGASTGIQKATTGEVDWGQVAVQGLIGAAGGGLGAGAGMLAGGARFAATSPFVRGAIAGGAESLLGGAATRGFNGENPFDPRGLATDLLLGGVTGGVGGKLGAAKAQADDLVTVYRFHTAADPRTLQSNLNLESAAVQASVRGALDTPAKIAARAEAHMRGATQRSPFVSLLLDTNAGANTTDDWLRKIITGHPKHLADVMHVRQAPDMSTFRIPRSQLIFPDASNALSRAETEVVYHGEDLVKHIVDTIPNPFMKP